MSNEPLLDSVSGGGGGGGSVPKFSSVIPRFAIPDASRGGNSAPEFWGRKKGERGPTLDAGFEELGDVGFDLGAVEYSEGSPNMDLTGLQTPLSASDVLRAYAAITAAAMTGFGCFYLASKLTLVRQGELALVRSFTGQCRALGPGWHLVNTVGCDIVKASMTEKVVQLGTLTILRILPGQVGKAQVNGQPRLLGPGVHLFNDPLFTYLGTEDAASPKISVADTLQVITVGQEQIGLCLANAVGHFLGPGRHGIFHLRFQWVGFKSAREEYITVGSKHRVLISEGRLGLAWDKGKPLVLEPTADNTARCFNSSTFVFERSVSATQQVIVHGSLKVITVRQGFVGVSFRNGALEVLPPGRCILDSVTHAFSGFLPTGQQTLQLESVDGMTSDNVGLKFDAAICVQVTDAKKAIAMLASSTATANIAMKGAEVAFDSENIWQNIQARARLALSIIIGNQRLNRGDGTESDDHSGSHPPYQPGRGGAPLSVPHNAAESAASSGYAGSGSGASAPPNRKEPDLFGGGGGDPLDPSPPKSAISFRTRIHDQFMMHFAQRMVRNSATPKRPKVALALLPPPRPYKFA